MTITPEGRMVLDSERPLTALHARVEFCTDDGTVVFVYDNPTPRLAPGDTLALRWGYPLIDYPSGQPYGPEGPMFEYGPDGEPRVVEPQPNFEVER